MFNDPQRSWLQVCKKDAVTLTVAGYAGMNANPTYATDSTASIMMMTFQYCEDGGEQLVDSSAVSLTMFGADFSLLPKSTIELFLSAHHSQILECIMSMKKNTFKVRYGLGFPFCFDDCKPTFA